MKNNQPVLVILTPGFPENESDTSCLPFLQSLIRTFNKNYSSIKIIVVTFQYPFISSKYAWNGNTVFSFGGKNKGKLSRRFLWFKVWRKLKKIKAENNVIGLFSLWFGECALIGHDFGKRFGIPHHCWIVGQDAKPGNKFVAKIKPSPHELIAISDFIADEFFKNYLIRPFYVITNGIEQELFEKVSHQRAIDVLGAGSLIPLKRYDTFIDCIFHIKKTFPQIYSVVAGKGRQDWALQKKVREHALENNIFFNGEMEHRNLLLLMQQSKVFLHPSSYEGFSMVCLEALYAGCHVISFCKPMNNDFENWHIVKTEEEMISKALEILSHPTFEYESVLPFSINETAEAVLELYNEVNRKNKNSNYLFVCCEVIFALPFCLLIFFELHAASFIAPSF
jgi:glycosyltransferase involved in cell wall biosynthesis